MEAPDTEHPIHEPHQQTRERNSAAIGWAEQGLVPDSVIRAGIRRLNRQRLEEIRARDCEAVAIALNGFVAHMASAPVALVPELANEQHYEVPPEFFNRVLGRHRKYSSCLWSEDVASLDEAEAAALQVTCERAAVEDGMRVLDLGCGWGSLSLWVAERYPGCRVTSVSNSAPQREYIEAQARDRGLDNIRVLTRDMNAFDATAETGDRFDRIVSVEMFEHMRNWDELFRRVAGWLHPEGRFFMHVFCHRAAAYAFEDRGPGDWMSRHFFSGGIMPSADLPLRFQRDLRLERQWKWSGRHYEKTANAWLERLDRQAPEVRALFAGVYGADQAQKWVQRWRIFFMACAELFGHDRGQEWFVSHYRFARASGQESGVPSAPPPATGSEG